MNRNINREELHYNFLKNIIIRLDLSGVFPQEMDSIIVESKPYLKGCGFNRFQEKKTEQIDIQLPNNNIPQIEGEIRNTGNFKIYNFINEDRGLSLDICNQFICLNVSSVKYIPFGDYFNYILDIYKIFKSKIDFLTLKRFGLRKTNICAIKDKASIKDYFMPQYFNVDSIIEESRTTSSVQHYTLDKDDKRINFISNIQQGKLDNTDVFQIFLDLDIYIEDDEKISNILNDNQKAIEMNKILFNIYISVLTDNFISKLCDENDVDFNDIIGVIKNE